VCFEIHFRLENYKLLVQTLLIRAEEMALSKVLF
jgi:hypothetical protein